MKKMLQRILVLALAATIFVMPASTVLAASNPVVVYKADDCIIINFEPDPMYLSPGYGFDFPNYADATRDWYVPAGKKLVFQVFTSEPNTTVRAQIYKNGNLIQDTATWSTIYGYIFEYAPESVDNRYTFVLTALADMHLIGYSAILA